MNALSDVSAGSNTTYWVNLALLVVGILFLMAVSALLGFQFRKTPATGQQGAQDRWSEVNLTVAVLVALALVFLSGWLLYSLTTKWNPDSETEGGLLIVAAIAAMLTLLFVMAAGFKSMNLADPTQPLGLPEGSIRAMIALVLIMVFIIFGIFLFRMVGFGTSTLVDQVVLNHPPAAADLERYHFARDVRLYWLESTNQPTSRPDGSKQYEIWAPQVPISDDGKRLAQQLLTTVGTLVVAVAGFYFGSTTVSSAVAAAQNTTGSPVPNIKDVQPRTGKKGEQVTLNVTGADFKSPRGVHLMKGNEVMEGREILSSTAGIQCKIMVDKDAGDDKWDLVVENEDGKQARLRDAFTIKAA